jgi:hypothetical protein
VKDSRDVDVEVQISLSLLVPDSGPVALQVGLRYSAADPYAVRAAFRGGDTTVEWVFARELLLGGLREASGVGDVHVWPGRAAGEDVVHISLSSPDGRAVLQADARELRRFLDATTALVPVGREEIHLDLDQVIAKLCASS